MFARSLLVAALLSATAASVSATTMLQVWQPTPSGTTAELRGLSVVSSTVAWASGAKGTVLRTVDGAHWQAMQVPGADKIDFRDIHAIDAKTAIVMGAGPGAASRIYRTEDGGASWKLMTTNQVAEGFWDAMAFWDKDNGILFGDPVKGSFQVYTTGDGGASWREVAAKGLEAMPNEGAFAASGTCLSVAGASDAWIATGGSATSRVFHSADRGKTWRAASTPIPAGAAARGVFSVAFLNAKEGFAAGGDYKETRMAGVNGAATSDGGATWTPVSIQPAGYMSVVAPVPGAPRALVAAGLAGSGYSLDAGKSWIELDRTPMNTVGFASPSRGWAVGPKGLLMKYIGTPLK
ncbi:WD40/YVTN/BNR-like repeat-containing protein [Massilia aerilata]|uniref:WD40/YVTN/BNR-like repeat-containing protein n=1 Tax=Massilia aerilata TaxID=453817 RepID=A0ABW0RUH8_9BURK